MNTEAYLCQRKAFGVHVREAGLLNIETRQRGQANQGRNSFQFWCSGRVVDGLEETLLNDQIYPPCSLHKGKSGGASARMATLPH